MNRAATIEAADNRDNIPYWHILLLLTAFFNAALRPDIDSDITLFRVLLPLIFLFLALKSTPEAKKLTIILVSYTALQSISILFSPYRLSLINAIFYINYFVMFSFSVYVYAITKKFNYSTFYIFITLYIYALIIFSAMQYLFDFQITNIQERPGLNSWYGNENDASLTLTAFILLRCRFGLSWKDIPAILASIIIIWYNGSRTCLLTLSIIPFYLVYRNYGWAYLATFTAFLVVISSIFLGFSGSLSNTLEEASEFLFTLYQGLIIIFELKVVPGIISSIDLRSMAAALAILDFLNYPIFGTGVGNTYTLIEHNSIIFGGLITSIHNMPLMIVTETGVIGVIFFILSLKSLSHVPFWSLIFWLGIFSLASVSSAGGFIINYFVLMVLIIIIRNPLDRAVPIHQPKAFRTLKVHKA